MRIAFVHNHPSGGAARAVHELGNQMSRRHAIDVYTLSTADEQFLPSRDYAARVRILPYRPRAPLHRGFYLNEARAYQDLHALERVSKQMAEAIDARAYDVVLASSCRYVQAPSVLQYLRTPAAYYCHEPPRRFLHAACRPDAGPLNPYQRLRASWHRPAQTLLDGVIARRDRRNVARASVLLTNSHFTASLIEAYYGRRAHVCHLGVDARRFQSDARGRGAYVLSVGAIDHHKGFDLLVEAVGLLPPGDRPELVIVGNAATPGVADHLRRLAVRRAVTLRMRVGVSDADLAAIYAGARLFAYAPHEEPFGLAVLEAMASGLPVVAVSEGGVQDSVLPGVTGLIVPRNAAAFAAAIGRVLADDAYAAALGRAGRRLATTDWTWDAAARRVEEALAGLAAGRARGGAA